MKIKGDRRDKLIFVCKQTVEHKWQNQSEGFHKSSQTDAHTHTHTHTQMTLKLIEVKPVLKRTWLSRISFRVYDWL